MGFFKKFKSFILPTIGAVIGNTIAPGVGGAIGASLGSGVSSYSSNHDILSALGSAGGTYLGSQVAGNLIGDKLGTVGSAFGAGNVAGTQASTLGANALASGLGASAANTVLNTGIGSILGGYAGGELAGNALLSPPKMQGPSGPAQFQPKREGEKRAPASLTGLGSLSGEQQSSNLANQGVYGGGLGPEEQSYFLNLQNRKLVSDSGQLADQSTLSPIEQSYMQKLGLGGYGNTRDLLEAMSKWSYA